MQRTDYKKIDIYLKRPNGLATYVASTTWARNLKIARECFASKNNHTASDVIAVYAEKR